MTNDLVRRLREPDEAVSYEDLCEAAERIEQLEAALQYATEYAGRLALALSDKHYHNQPFELLPDLLGRIDQIDNMTCGLARAALEGERKNQELVWPEPSPPKDGVSHYDHIIAHGFTIEWKSWKDYPGYCVMSNQIDEEFIGCFDTLDEAKEAARAALAGEKKDE
jgi:hypothetical protein